MREQTIEQNKKRRIRVLRLIEILFISFFSFVSVNIVFTVFKEANLNPVWDVPEKNVLWWLILSSIILSFIRFFIELSFKNSFGDKQLSRCAIFTVLSTSFSSLTLRIVFYVAKINVRLTPIFVELFVYFVVLTFVRFILSKIELHKKQRILIIAEKAEAIDYAVKLVKEGNKKNSIHAIFLDSPACIDSYVREKIESSDVVYFGKYINPHLKNIYVAYTTANLKKQAYVVPNSYEILTRLGGVSKVGDTMAVEARPLELNWFQCFIKRLFDILSSGVALLLLWPIMIVVGLMIHFQDGGPALYKQERVTKNGRVFLLYKFRSMIVDAEKKTGAILMKTDDDRLTKIGKFIRKTRLDELPQLWNIFKGDMSVIGPRPERPVFVEQFLSETPEYRYRLNVKAGLSGYAQIKGTYNTSYKDKLRWDLMYISNYSFGLDLYIMWKTLIALFDKKSAAGLENLQGIDFLNSCDRLFKIDDKHLHIYSNKKKDKNN